MPPPMPGSRFARGGTRLVGPPPSFHLSFSSFYEEADREGANGGQLERYDRERGVEGRRYSLALSAKRFPGPQAPAPPASRESPGPASQESALSFAFLPRLQKPGELGRETGLQAAGRRPRARRPPGEGACDARPLPSERFCSRSAPWGKGNSYPGFRPWRA